MHLRRVVSLCAFMRPRRVIRPCALQSFRLTIVPTVRGIVQRVAGLPVVPPGRSWRGAHLLLVVTLDLVHDQSRCREGYATTGERVCLDKRSRM
jgi:hypothetical protein